MIRGHEYYYEMHNEIKELKDYIRELTLTNGVLTRDIERLNELLDSCRKISDIRSKELIELKEKLNG